MYDIWHGTVESCDGLFQLLQIIDYIWTWARDMYRPKISQCLSALVPRTRARSNSTDISLGRSQSVLSEATLRPRKRARISASIEQNALADVSRSHGNFSANQAHRLHPYGPNSTNSEQCKYPRTGLRHSNLVLFCFRSFRCPSRAQANRNSRIRLGHEITLETFESLRRSQSVFFFELTSNQIECLERLWTGDDSKSGCIPESTAALDERKFAYFYFRTFCRGTDWQIVRELNCVLYDMTDVEQLFRPQRDNTALGRENQASDSDWHTHLVKLIAMVRHMTGKMSISYAVNNTRLVPSRAPDSGNNSNILRWGAERSSHLEHLENPASRTYWSSDSYSESWKLIALEPQTLEEAESQLPMIVPKDWGQVGGILTKKPQTWPVECPKFCFFVLLDIEASNRDQLGRLFASVLQQRELYGVTGESSGQEAGFWDAEDRRLIAQWLKWFTR